MVLSCSGFLGAVRVVLRVVRVVQGPLVAPGGSESPRGSPRNYEPLGSQGTQQGGRIRPFKVLGGEGVRPLAEAGLLAVSPR